MSWYHWTLALAALFTAILTARLGLRRSVLWIGALTADYIVSVGYLYMPKPYMVGAWWPPQSAVAALCDAAVCILIYMLGRRRWEVVWLYALMLLSVAVNLLYTTGMVFGFPPVPPHEIYAIILEVIDYAALALILGTGLLNLVSTDGRSFARGLMAPVHVARASLFTRHQPSEALRKERK